MSAHTPVDFESLGKEEQEQVNAVCDRLEEAWRQGFPARAEDYLNDVVLPLRAVLLRELLRLECEYRFLRLEAVREEELRERFPGRDEMLREVVEQTRVSALSRGLPGFEPGPVPDLIGWLEATDRFRILSVLGEGGSGTVYRAEAEAFGGAVAIKVPRPDVLVDGERRGRFLREGQAAIGLVHPGIVRVLEVGEAGPVCFLVSEFVDGLNLAQWLEARIEPVSFPHAAVIVQTIARAIHHAHGRGVMHCDLKPANILVAPGADLNPKVADFGLARIAGDGAVLSRSGEVLGTPLYMAPEQAAGKRREVTARTDVYALGVILYELLAGHRLFPSCSPLEMLYRVLYEDPVPLRVSRPDVPPNLEAICLKCLDKRPDARYSTAVELADDLGRFLEGKRTVARLPGLASRTARWARRHPWRASAACFGLVLVVFLAFHILQQSATLAERDGLVVDLEAERGRLTEEGRKLRRHLYPEEIRRAWKLAERNEPQAVMQTLDEWIPKAAEEDLRGFEWFYLRRLLGRGEKNRLECSPSPVYSLALAPDGASLAAAGADGRVRLCALSPLRCKAELVHPDEVNDVAYSPDGVRLATACDDQKIRVWSAEGKLLATLDGHQGKVRRVAFSADGTLLASAGSDATIRLWTASEPFRLVQVIQDAVTRLKTFTFLGDRRDLAAGGEDGHLRFYHGCDGAQFDRLAGPAVDAQEVAASADGRLLAVACQGGVVELWERDENPGGSAAWRSLGRAEGFQVVRELAFSSDGRWLAMAGDVSVQVWSVRPFRRRCVVRGHEGRVWALRLHTSGQLFTGGADGVVRCWAVDELSDARSATVTADCRTIAFMPDSGGIVALAAPSLRVSLPGLSTEPIAPGAGLSLKARAVAQEPAKGRWVVLDVEGDVYRCEPIPAASENRREGAAHPDAPKSFQWTVTRILRLKECQRQVLGRCSDQFEYSALSPDGAFVAEADGREARVWETSTGRLAGTLQGHQSGVTVLAFGPGGVIASGSHDGVIRVWEVSSGRLMQTCVGHAGGVRALAFRPEGNELASGSNDFTVRVWDWETGKEKWRLLGHKSGVRALAFSPDGRTLATGGVNDGLRLWHAATGRELVEFLPVAGIVLEMRFSADGRYLAALTLESTAVPSLLHLWDAGPAASAARSRIEAPRGH